MTQFDESTLNEYLDGTLDAETGRQVEHWLATSAAARAMLADLQQTFSALANLDDVPLTSDLSAAIVTRIEHTETAVIPTWVRRLLGIQIITALGMLITLWPALNRLLMNGRAAFTAILSQIIWPQIDMGELMAAWGTAVWHQLQFNPPAVDLAANQWSILLVLTFLAWLAGNRLLFSDETHSKMKNGRLRD